MSGVFVKYKYDIGEEGFTVNIYRNNGTEDLENDRARVVSLYDILASATGVFCTLGEAVWSFVDVFSDSLATSRAGAALTNAAGNRRDQATSGLKFRIEASSLYRRSLILRGVPDSWLQYSAGDIAVPAGTAEGFITALKAELQDVAKGWALRVLSKAAGDAKYLLISGIAVVGGQVVYTVAGAPPVPGQAIKIRGAQGLNVRQFNGVTNVISVAGQAVTTSRLPKNSDPFTYIPAVAGPPITSASMAFRKYIYAQITNVVFEDYASRKVGKSPFARRGRRKVQS